MTIKKLIAWQLESYFNYHQDTFNLWLHIIAVPVFNLSLLGLIVSLIILNFSYSCLSFFVLFSSIILQAIGHKREVLPPEKFTSGFNLFIRIIIEQTITFPKFVISGGWYCALKK